MFSNRLRPLSATNSPSGLSIFSPLDTGVGHSQALGPNIHTPIPTTPSPATRSSGISISGLTSRNSPAPTGDISAQLYADFNSAGSTSLATQEYITSTSQFLHHQSSGVSGQHVCGIYLSYLLSSNSHFCRSRLHVSQKRARTSYCVAATSYTLSRSNRPCAFHVKSMPCKQKILPIGASYYIWHSNMLTILQTRI